MKHKFLLMTGWLVFGFALAASAGGPQRIGHTTFAPRHTSPDDRGLYTALIDATNGYAYFVGNYLIKVDITGNLPVQVGPAIATGQSSESAIDTAAGFAYLLGGGAVRRYALGTGANPVTSNASLTLLAGTANSIVIDDSDPNPANHYGYVICTVSGSTAKVAKVALSTFTELGSVPLQTGETNFWFGRSDAKNGYGYFGSFPNSTISNAPMVLKIKFTPGTNAPVRIGTVRLDTAPEFLDGASIDTVHGYAYYGTYESDTNNPAVVYKVKLEAGDVAPTLVGKISLHAGESRLAASVVDPQGGYVYFANDNTYPGGVYQLSLNGTNLPVEISYLQFQGGTNSSPPPNGTTTNNTTTDISGLLPFGEVFFRSAVFDPVRGYAYFGQDSRPNQVVKVKLAQVDPFTLNGAKIQANGSLQFTYTNIPGAPFTALTTTNLSFPLTNWLALGPVTESPPGQYQFTDLPATNSPPRYYRVRSP